MTAFGEDAASEISRLQVIGLKIQFHSAALFGEQAVKEVLTPDGN
jgi:hypothetical protein